jgi:hypothetical protein
MLLLGVQCSCCLNRAGQEVSCYAHASQNRGMKRVFEGVSSSEGELQSQIPECQEESASDVQVDEGEGTVVRVGRDVCIISRWMDEGARMNLPPVISKDCSIFYRQCNDSNFMTRPARPHLSSDRIFIDQLPFFQAIY